MKRQRRQRQEVLMIFFVSMAFIIIAKMFAKMMEWACIIMMWTFILGVKLAVLPVTLTWKLICHAVGR